MICLRRNRDSEVVYQSDIRAIGGFGQAHRGSISVESAPGDKPTVVEQLRFQSLGFLSCLGGYRRYPSEMTKRGRFIKRAQALGFTLEKVEGRV
jgi:hypothetical protein